MSGSTHEIAFYLFDKSRYGEGPSLFPWTEADGFGDAAPADIRALDHRMRRHLAGQRTTFSDAGEAQAAIERLDALLHEDFMDFPDLVPFAILG